MYTHINVCIYIYEHPFCQIDCINLEGFTPVRALRLLALICPLLPKRLYQSRGVTPPLVNPF